MADGLAGLVEGWTRANEEKQKVAKSIADQQARAFTQEFQVKQAKDAAAQQVIRNKQEQERLDTEKAYAEIRKNADEERTRHDKATEEFNNLKTQDKLLVDLGKIDLNDRKQANDLREKAYALAIKRGFDEETSGLMADQHMADLRKSSIEKQSLLSQVSGMLGQQQSPNAQGGAVPGAQPQQQTGNPIMDMLRSRQYHGFNAPSEAPAAMTQYSPKEQEALQKAAADTEAKQAAKRLSDARAQDIQDQKEFRKAVAQSRALLSDAQRKSVDAARTRADQLQPFKIENAIVSNAHIKASTTALLANVDIARDREKRLEIEGALKNAVTATKAKDDLRKQVDSTRDKKLKLNEEVMRNLREAEKQDMWLQDPAVKNNPVETKRIQGFQKALAAQLVDLNTAYAQTNEEYLQTLDSATKAGVIRPTTSSGGTDKSAAKGNEAAIAKEREAAIKKSKALQKQRLAPVIAPSPGSKPGAFKLRPLGKKSAADPLGILGH